MKSTVIKHSEASSGNTKTTRAAVFLDRDGTLNHSIVRAGKPYPPRSVAEFKIISGVQEGCFALHKAGFILIVATNQPDVGRGSQNVTEVEEMHKILKKAIPEIAHIEVSYDSGQAEIPSEFRKPAPGMLLRASSVYGIDLSKSWMVGDRWRDVSCGFNAGCRTIFIDYGYDEKCKDEPEFVVKDFGEAVKIILSLTSTKP